MKQEHLKPCNANFWYKIRILCKKIETKKNKKKTNMQLTKKLFFKTDWKKTLKI